MKTTAALALLATLASASTVAAQEPPTVAAPAFQVIRLGDNSLSCEVLIAEINTLNAEMTAAQQAMSARASQAANQAMRASRGGQRMGWAMSLGSMAASVVPGASLAVAAATTVASTAQATQAQAAQAQAMQDLESMGADAAAASTAMVGPVQRIAHLSEISRTKGC
jgi:hypothetical protein